LDDGIGDIFVSVEAAEQIRGCVTVSRRFASRAAAAIVTARHFRSIDREGLSINVNSSSQTAVETRACSGPNSSVTAPMNADNSHSALCVSAA
jgi:hypothetical protein